jgi:hypothetical protein
MQRLLTEARRFASLTVCLAAGPPFAILAKVGTHAARARIFISASPTDYFGRAKKSLIASLVVPTFTPNVKVGQPPVIRLTCGKLQWSLQLPTTGLGGTLGFHFYN